MSAGPPIRRRSNFAEMPVSYAAVGASRDHDLMKFPPTGSTPFEDAVQLGSGQERFLVASTLLMTWGAQKRAGFEVTNIVPGDGGSYIGVSFGPDGKPQPGNDTEDHFGPDGDPYLTVGTTLNYGMQGEANPRSMLVVYAIDEPRRVGFAWGSTSTDGAIGEELFVVEHRSDDSVWAMTRGFLTAPAAGLLSMIKRNVVKDAISAAHKQIAALAPGTGKNGASLPSEPRLSAAEDGVAETAPEGDESHEPVAKDQ